MLKVMLKDLILSRTVLLVNGSLFGAFLAFLATVPEDVNPGFFVGSGSLMLAFLPVSMVIREDKFNAMTLQCSLPVTRREVVRGRFALAEGMGLLGMLGGILLGGLIPFSHFHLLELLAPAPLLTGVTLVTLVLSFLLPFSLRYGVKGLIVFLVAAQVLGVILLSTLMVAGSNIDRWIIEGIIGFFVRSRELLGGPGIALALLGVLALMYGVSYLVALRSFENREL